MAPIWKPQPKEVIQSWIDALVTEASDELNDWELGFLDSIQTRLTSRGELTQLQEEKLEKLYTDKTK